MTSQEREVSQSCTSTNDGIWTGILCIYLDFCKNKNFSRSLFKTVSNEIQYKLYLEIYFLHTWPLIKILCHVVFQIFIQETFLSFKGGLNLWIFTCRLGKLGTGKDPFIRPNSGKLSALPPHRGELSITNRGWCILTFPQGNHHRILVTSTQGVVMLHFCTVRLGSNIHDSVQVVPSRIMAQPKHSKQGAAVLQGSCSHNPGKFHHRCIPCGGPHPQINYYMGQISNIV
jgi:hypothetical protein